MFFLEKLDYKILLWCMFTSIIVLTELIVQVEEHQKGIWTT